VRFTVRRMMIALATFAVVCWIGVAAIRVQNDSTSRWVYHLWQGDGNRHSGPIFWETVHQASYWPRFSARLLGRPWPGGFTCDRCVEPDGRRHRRIIGTVFGSDPATYAPLGFVSPRGLARSPFLVLRDDYQIPTEARLFPSTNRVVIKADVNELHGNGDLGFEGRTEVTVPSRTTFVIRVVNSGSDDATDVVTSAVLSDNVIARSPGPSLTTPRFDPSTRAVVFPPIERLPPGSSAEFEVRAFADRSGIATCRVLLQKRHR
jgi:hypothetical protein